jgi:hypothetical protein
VGNLAALFSYRLVGMSTVEIRTGCRFWVTRENRGRSMAGNRPLSQPGTLGKWYFGRKTRYTRTRVRSRSGMGIGVLVCSLGANCSVSVEPASAVVEAFPLVITWVTMSK